MECADQERVLVREQLVLLLEDARFSACSCKPRRIGSEHFLTKPAELAVLVCHGIQVVFKQACMNTGMLSIDIILVVSFEHRVCVVDQPLDVPDEVRVLFAVPRFLRVVDQQSTIRDDVMELIELRHGGAVEL